MPSTHSLLKTLQRDFPTISFRRGSQFNWSPDSHVITYASTDAALLLHEVAHAALEHRSYLFDIELIKMERAAWDYTTSVLASRYAISIDEDLVEDMLTTYRDWLHDRSQCPQCEATGFQQSSRSYRCPACDAQWRVNEARSCALRRYTIQPS
jgi:hypothetical protein